MKKYTGAIVFVIASIVALIVIICLPETMPADTKEVIIYNDAEYTLWVENESIGTKLYVRLINGVLTEDYILAFYDSEGNLTSRKKSDFTLTDEEIAQAQALWEQMMNMDAPVYDIKESDNTEYQFLRINGEIVLVLKVVTQHTIDGCSETIFYNALTGEMIAK